MPQFDISIFIVQLIFFLKIIILIFYFVFMVLFVVHVNKNKMYTTGFGINLGFLYVLLFEEYNFGYSFVICLAPYITTLCVFRAAIGEFKIFSPLIIYVTKIRKSHIRQPASLTNLCIILEKAVIFIIFVWRMPLDITFIIVSHILFFIVFTRVFAIDPKVVLFIGQFFGLSVFIWLGNCQSVDFDKIRCDLSIIHTASTQDQVRIIDKIISLVSSSLVLYKKDLEELNNKPTKSNSKTSILENIKIAHEKQKLSQRIIILNELYEILCYEKLFLESQNNIEDDFIRSIQAAELHAAEQNTLLAEENARFAKLRAEQLETIAVSDPGERNKSYFTIGRSDRVVNGG